MNTIHQIFLAVKGGAILENLIPPGADLRAWEALLNRYDPTKPRKRTTRTASTGRSKRSRKAAMDKVLAAATLTLVERVNGETQADTRAQQIKDLLAEIEADVKARLAGRERVYDLFLRPDPLNMEPQRGGYKVRE